MRFGGGETGLFAGGGGGGFSRTARSKLVVGRGDALVEMEERRRKREVVAVERCIMSVGVAVEHLL